jgi:excisionase family DNA binding protein
VSERPYSPETLGDHWGCSAEKIRQMCRRGDLAFFRLGKLIRIPANEVERIECQNTDSSSTEGNGASPHTAWAWTPPNCDWNE